MNFKQYIKEDVDRCEFLKNKKSWWRVKFLHEHEYSIWKYIILGLNKIFIFLLIWVIALLAEAQIGNLAFCLGWIAVCSAIAYLAINPFIEKYDYIVKKEIRKSETKEALKELKEEEASK